MAGVSIKSFRILLKECGADVVFTEMISINGLFYNNTKTKKLLEFEEIERPIAIQLFGNKVELFRYAVEFILNSRFIPDIIDVNAGCPVKKIVSQGYGSALLKNPYLLGKIIEEVKNVVRDRNIKVSVKIRAGWDKNSINYKEVGKIAQEAGADFITFHGRVRSQFYSGEANWDWIADLNNYLEIPVVGNGDIFSVEDYLNVMNNYGISNVMIARGSLNNPCIFKQIKDYIYTGEYKRLEPKERLDIILKHIKYLEKYNPEINVLPFFRKHLMWYIKNIRNAREFREYITKENNLDKLKSKLIQIFDI